MLGSIAFTASPRVSQMGPAGQQLVAQARTAFVGGVSDAMVIAAGVVLVTAVAVALLAPGAEPVGMSEDEPGPRAILEPVVAEASPEG